jgi:DNA-directed RNA polymerase subunit K/omega
VNERIIEYLRKVDLKTKPYRLTRYEKARIVAARALQLSLGAMPLIEVSNMPKDPVMIAIEELKRGLLPMTIIRRTPAGEVELIPASKLIELERKLFKRVHGLED